MFFREAFKGCRISYSLSLVVLTPAKEILSNVLELTAFITFQIGFEVSVSPVLFIKEISLRFVVRGRSSYIDHTIVLYGSNLSLIKCTQFRKLLPRANRVAQSYSRIFYILILKSVLLWPFKKVFITQTTAFI
jgi:hypothetical protein